MLFLAPASSAEVFVDHVDVDAFMLSHGSIFWHSDCGGTLLPSGRVQRKPAGGGPHFTVFDPVVCTPQNRIWSESVAADATFVYWIDAQGRVLKKAWGGSNSVQLATMEQLNLSTLARPMIVAGSTRVYWVEHTLDGGGESITKSRVFWASKDGTSGRNLLFDLTPFYVRRIEATGDYLYILTSDSTLRRGSNPFNLQVVSAGAVRSFAITPDATSGTGIGRVAWANTNFTAPSTEIWSAPLSTITQTVRHYTAAQAWDVTAMATDHSGHVYWYENRGPGGGPIQKASLIGNVSVLIGNAPLQRDLASTGDYLFWRVDASRIDRTTTQSDSLDIDLGALNLEVIQAVQNSTNDVPLISGKPAYARLYSRLLSATGGLAEVALAEPWAVLRAYRVSNGVRGAELTYFGTSGLSPYAMGSDAPVVTLGTPDRGLIEDSVWFLLPEAWTGEGTIDLVATVNPARTLPETSHANNTASLRVTFESKEIIPLWMHRAYYRTSNGKIMRYGDNLPKYTTMYERALTVLPTPGVRLYWSIIELGLGGDAYDFGNKDENTRRDEGSRLLCDLNSQRSEFLCKFPDTTPSIRFCAIVPNLNGVFGGLANGKACWWKDDYTTPRPPHNQPWAGMTMAHELAHVFGQPHVNCGGPAGPYDDYIYSHIDWISGPVRSEHGGGSRDGIGWDPITETLMRPDDVADYLTYCSPQWTSDVRWERIANRLRPGPAAAPGSAPPPPAAGPPAGSHLYFRGRVGESPADSAFLLAYPASPPLAEQLQRELDGPGDRANWELRAYDDSGELVATSNPLVQEVSDGGSEQSLFLGLIEAVPGMRHVDLVAAADPGTVLARRTGGLNPPEIALLEPAGGENVTLGDPLAIRWEAEDPDGDRLEYVVRHSRDGGDSWDILRTGLAATELVFETSFLPGGDDCRVQVEASDGILSTIVVSEAFTVSNRPPQPVISTSSPGSGLCGNHHARVFRPGDMIILGGRAFDPEDGPLTGEQLSWSVAGPAVYAGSGEGFELYDLAPGEYAVSLTAEDSGGLSAQAQDSFVVAPKSLPVSQATPVLDGFLDDPAYQAGGQALPLRYDTGELGSVVMCWDGAALYVGLSGMPVGVENPRDWVGICLDPDNSDHEFAQPDDFRFVLYADGELKVDRGTGSGWTALADATGLQGRVSQAGTRWNAELCIDGAWLAGREGEIIGLRAGQYHRRFSGDDSNWPRISGWRSPWSWGDVLLGGESAVACHDLEDSYEDNDSRQAAFDLTANEGLFLSGLDGPGRQADDDWFRIEVEPGFERVVIECSFVHAEGDIDLELSNSQRAVVAASRGTLDYETLDITVPTPGAYFIRVHKGNAGNAYDLRWQSFPPCEVEGPVVALYDAGLGTPPNPTSASGGGWTLQGGGAVTSGPVAGDRGFGAWNVSDLTEAQGEFGFYSVTPTAADFAAAASRGWRLYARVRMVDGAGQAATQFVMFDDGVTRWSMALGLDDDSDLTVELQTSAAPAPFTLTSGGAGTHDYHDLALIFDAQSGLASFHFDGQLVTSTHAGTGSQTFTHMVAFGAASSAGQGSANYHHVSLTIPPLHDGALDLDGDGLGYWLECFFGTDSSAPNGSPWTLSPPAAGSLTLTYPVAPGHWADQMHWQWSPDMHQWFDAFADTVVVGPGPGGSALHATTITGFPPDAPRAFVRMGRGR